MASGDEARWRRETRDARELEQEGAMTAPSVIARPRSGRGNLAPRVDGFASLAMTDKVGGAMRATFSSLRGREAAAAISTVTDRPFEAGKPSPKPD